jgi:hypothetical protein
MNQTRTVEHRSLVTPHHLPRDLGDGLVLRWATPADREPLAQFNGRVHGRDRFDDFVAAWTRDLMSGSHPTCGPSDFTLVEDTRREGKIVSSLCLIPQAWTYAGLPFGVGRPEAVGTDPEYRRRGLVRAQFEAIHAQSAALGHLVQGITGIPWYYRQFGYEYALDLGGGRIAYFSNVPTLKAGETEPYRLRPMTPSDLPFATPLYDALCARSLVACPRADDVWRYRLTGPSPDSFLAPRFQVIETAEGRPVGYVAPGRELWGGMFVIFELEVAAGQSLRAVMPPVLRAMKAQAEAEAAAQKKDVNALYFNFGREHPAFDAIPERLPKFRPPYGWYIRVADVPGFLRHVAPVLEARLALSPLAGHTGELKINEYTRGFKMVLEKGRITSLEPWQRPDGEEENAAFPPLVFLQLLFGQRALADLRAAYPDCWADDEAEALLNALFPRLPSNVIPLS